MLLKLPLQASGSSTSSHNGQNQYILISSTAQHSNEVKKKVLAYLYLAI